MRYDSTNNPEFVHEEPHRLTEQQAREIIIHGRSSSAVEQPNPYFNRQEFEPPTAPLLSYQSSNYGYDNDDDDGLSIWDVFKFFVLIAIIYYGYRFFSWISGGF